MKVSQLRKYFESGFTTVEAYAMHAELKEAYRTANIDKLYENVSKRHRVSLDNLAK